MLRNEMFKEYLIEKSEVLSGEARYHSNLAYWLESELEVEKREGRIQWLHEQLEIEEIRGREASYGLTNIHDQLYNMGVAVETARPIGELVKDYFFAISKETLTREKDKLKKMMSREIRSDFTEIDEQVKAVRMAEDEVIKYQEQVRRQSPWNRFHFFQTTAMKTTCSTVSFSSPI